MTKLFMTKLFTDEEWEDMWRPFRPNERYGVYVEGGNMPKVYHTDRETAEKEAKRLCEKTGKPCTILQKICTVKPIEKFDIEYFT